jgi:hypothetical protein
MGDVEPCWFFILSCGLLGVIRNLVKEVMYFGDWNTRQGYSKGSCGMVGVFQGLPLVFNLQVNVVNFLCKKLYLSHFVSLCFFLSQVVVG